MSESTLFTVVDINSGIGGRSRVFQDLGIRVLSAIENEKIFHKVFHQINPDVSCLDVAPLVENLERVPKADILTADITPLKIYPYNKHGSDELLQFLSKIVLRDAPKAFVFQASAAILRKERFQFLETAAMRRYSVSYQAFREADYTGFSITGRQLYIVGIRNDIGFSDFSFPAAYRTREFSDCLELPHEIDPWYRQLPNGLTINQSLEVGAIYVRDSQNGIMKTDSVNLSVFSESYYCDAYGLRRLTHNEYAAIKGYAGYCCDFNYHTNRRAVYRMLFSAANVYIFHDIVCNLKNVLCSNPGEFNPADWPSETKPLTDTGSKKPEKVDAKRDEKLIRPRNTLRSIHVDKLKGLRNLDISFEKNLTAIMGVNCSGKSTLLHALACVFQPVEEGQNHRFNFFFTPNPDALWNDSKFSITYRDENAQSIMTKDYHKKSDRWSPKYSRRPKREVFFMGIDSCAPEIEKERQTTYISYSTDTVEGRQSEHIKKTLSYIMDKAYAELTNNKTRKKTMIGVCTSDDIRYSALSMGAGEQRVFKILQLVYTAPAFSLVLIDEIDLLLHVKALERLIETLSQAAEQRKIHIIFTTHSLAMRNLTDYVDIRYLYQTKNKTMVFDAITPDIVYALANETERPLTVYVEDDLAETVVQNVISEMGLSRHTVVRIIGSSENAFTLAAGLVLQEDPLLSNKLIVLDGDVYRAQEDKEKQIVRKLSGTEADHGSKIEKALSLITQLSIPEKTSPEKYIHSLIIDNGLPDDTANEILHCARQITVARDSHDWLDGIVEQMNQDRKVTLFQIMNNASTHREWERYVENVYRWLKAKKEELNL